MFVYFYNQSKSWEKLSFLFWFPINRQFHITNLKHMPGFSPQCCTVFSWTHFTVYHTGWNQSHSKVFTTLLHVHSFAGVPHAQVWKLHLQNLENSSPLHKPILIPSYQYHIPFPQVLPLFLHLVFCYIIVLLMLSRITILLAICRYSCELRDTNLRDFLSHFSGLKPCQINSLSLNLSCVHFSTYIYLLLYFLSNNKRPDIVLRNDRPSSLNTWFKSNWSLYVLSHYSNSGTLSVLS